VSNQGFKLEQLFGSKTRARLLALFLQRPDQAYFVRELTRRIDAQLNSVRRELQNLVELGIVVERVDQPVSKSALGEKKKYYAANPEFMLFDDLRGLFTKASVFLKNNLVQEIDDHGDIAYLAFTGRFVGNNAAPTDILIVGNIDQKALQKVVAAFESEMGSEINYTLMPKEEFLYRRQVTDRFLFSLLEGEKIVMVDRVKV
jgi:predicted transcriptional regulator